MGAVVAAAGARRLLPIHGCRAGVVVLRGGRVAGVVVAGCDRRHVRRRRRREEEDIVGVGEGDGAIRGDSGKVVGISGVMLGRIHVAGSGQVAGSSI